MAAMIRLQWPGCCSPSWLAVPTWYWARALPGKGIRTVDLNGADHDLDVEHHSYVLCLASAHSWTAVVGF
jgi:hypothetical protein